MNFTFQVVSEFPNKPFVGKRIRVMSSSIVLGDLDMNGQEWTALKRLLGSGAVEAAATGINCQIMED